MTTHGYVSAVAAVGFYMQQDLTGTLWGGIDIYIPSSGDGVGRDALATLSIGDYVEVTGGPFLGLKGPVTQIGPKKGEVAISLPSLPSNCSPKDESLPCSNPCTLETRLSKERGESLHT